MREMALKPSSKEFARIGSACGSMASIASRRTSAGWGGARGPAILVMHDLMEPAAKRPIPEAISRTGGTKA
jgi:hypothetical protein